MPYFNFNTKRVFYRERGQGEPVILLHGNSVSSRMFATLFKLYSRQFQVITLDFPGHGKSERMEKFETDFWHYNSKVVLALMEELNLGSASIIGTSGGALVALNLGLDHPEKVNYLIADSFEGAYPLASYIASIERDREKDKKKFLAKLFWYYFHGKDWREVVDLDTRVNVEFASTGKSFFHKPISELKVPTLLTGSLEDEYCNHLDKIYGELKTQNTALQIHLFEKGRHPAMISNKKEFLNLIASRLSS